MRILTGVTVADAYSDAATIQGVIDSNGGYFLIQNFDVLMGLQYNINGQLHWTQDIHVPVGSGQIYPGTAGMRFKNFVPGSNALLNAALSEKQEPSISIGASGVANVGSSGGIQVVTSLPASPTNGVQCILTDSLTIPTWSWLLQFDTALTPTIGWRFIGGSKLQTINNATMTLARAGNYDVTITGSVQPQSANPQSVQFILTQSVGTIVGKNTIEFTGSASGGTQMWPDGASQFKVNGVTAGATLTWGTASGVGSLVGGVITATPIIITG